MKQDKIRGLGSDIEFIVIDEVEELEKLARLKQEAWDDTYSKRRAYAEEANSMMILDGSSEMGGMWDETMVLDGLPALTKAEINSINSINSVAADIAAPKNRAQRRARNSQLRKMETRKVKK